MSTTSATQRRLAEARTRAVSPIDAVSGRAEVEVECLQMLDKLLAHPQYACEALWLALRLTRWPQGPSEAERRLAAWAAEREAKGGVTVSAGGVEEHSLTRAELELLAVVRALGDGS